MRNRTDKPLTFGSLFSGVGGFDRPLEQAGMTCLWQAEIDKQCRSVLRRHWPDVTLLDDVRDVHATDAVRRPDLVCAGWPCQGNSVAGRRAGMADERSGLWGEVVRVLAEFTPTWFLGENVPGILSVNGGRDWAAVLADLAELGYGFAYRVLDSQWFGVPQRRRRVFIVGCLGDWRRAAEVLFERDCLPWDSPPSRTTGQRVAASLTRGADSGGRGGYAGRRREDDVNLAVASALNCMSGSKGANGNSNQNLITPAIVGTLQSHRKEHGHAMSTQQAAESGHLIAADMRRVQCERTVGASVSRGSGYGAGCADAPAVPMSKVQGAGTDLLGERGPMHEATVLNAGLSGRGEYKQDYPATLRAEGGDCGGGSEQLIAHTLRAEGFDASEDGTGRGTPLIPIDMRQASRGGTFTNNRPGGSSGGAPGTGVGEPGDPSFTVCDSHVPAICFDERNITSKANRTRVEAGRECHTLHESPPAIAFNWQAGGTKAMVGGKNEYSDALQASQIPAIAYAIQERAGAESETSGPGGKGWQEDRAFTLEARHHQQSVAAVGVRRLTPLECERLQGWPDNWTRWDADGNELADSPRYRMCGNGVSMPPVEWIGRRIVEASNA